MKKQALLLFLLPMVAALFSGFKPATQTLGTTACKWFVPNVFSPNDDGTNDTFLPYSDCELSVLSYEMRIFNRWGRLVFETKSIDEGWNGKARGEDLPAGVYAYYIRYSTTSGNDLETETEVLSGDVAIIR